MKTKEPRMSQGKFYYISLAIAAIGAVLMAAMIMFASWPCWAVASGRFTEDGAMILKSPVGILSMCDIYVGLLLFACWVAYREGSHAPLKAAIWILASLVLGNFVTALYVVLQLLQSKGDWHLFFLGYSRTVGAAAYD